MQVEFLKKLSKDIEALKSRSSKQALIKLIETLEAADSLESIPNTKKLKGHRSAYRIRLGEYRLGLFYEGNTILLARFLHRKDIYKLFP